MLQRLVEEDITQNSKSAFEKLADHRDSSHLNSAIREKKIDARFLTSRKKNVSLRISRCQTCCEQNTYG